MPNTESAKRGHRKAERRRIANKNQRSTLRTLVKKVRASAAAGNKAEAEAALAIVIKRLDQAADKHLIHKNKASRSKSRLTVLVNKVGPKAAPATPPAG